MQQLLGGQGRAGLPQQTSGSQVETTILEPTAPSNPVLPQSRLEQIISARVGVALTQFGYDQLGVGRPVSLPQMGGVQDSYVLGPGDEIIVTLRGQENAEYRVQVDRDGQVVLPRLNPIPASGRTLGDLRQDIISNVHRAYVSTEGFVSVGRMRQISVIVAGEVGSPGVRILTGLSSPIDAILISGGIKKSGSLRDVRLIRQGRAIAIDLYAFLTSGTGTRQISLADGDRIVVPPLGKTVAAAGWVRRPGIYEIGAGRSAMSVRELTGLAGGLEVAGRYRLAVLRVETNGQTQFAAVTSQSEPVRDGEILLILPEADEVINRATLAGGTPLAGSYSIKQGTRLSDLLRSPGALGTSPYTIFGIISRRDRRTFLRSLIAFSPIAALTGVDDPALQSDDVVRIFSMRESRLLSEALSRFEKSKEYKEELTRNPFAVAQPSDTGQMPEGEQKTDQYGQPLEGGQSPSGQSGPASQLGNQQQPAIMQPATNGLPYGAGAANSATSQSALATNPQLTATEGASAAQAAAAANATNTSNESLPGLTQQLSRLRSSETTAPPAANFEQEQPVMGTIPTNTEATTLGDVASQLGIETIVLLNFLEDHEVTLDGAVRAPGAYVVGPGSPLHDLVMVAGGTVHWADQSGIELISTSVDEAAGRSATTRKNLPLNSANLSNYLVKPKDELRFREVFNDVGVGAVTLEGEVRFPGQYKIIRGEHLADLMKRAGGLTNVAYPYGTVYLRRSVAALEEESFRRTAETVENQLLLAMTHNAANANTTRLDPTSFGTLQVFVNSIRNQKGLGRISVSADPNLLARKKEQDILLEAGDVIYVPQRPSTVAVLGSVLQPGSFTYQPGLLADDYLKKAGGVTAFADDSLTYIVMPDGSAERLDRAWLPFGSTPIPPGSVIVVPRDIAPLQWSDILQNATQVFSQLAIAGASLAVISGK